MGGTSAQHEISRKRESEITKLRKDLELANVQFESAEASLRKRHTEALNDLQDQLDYMSKQRSRLVL